MKTLIIACGYSGRRIAEHAQNAGQQLTCTGKSIAHKQTENRILIDLDKPETLSAISNQKWDQCYFLAPPPNTGNIDTRMQHFLAAFETSPLPRLLYFSTTAVYGDCKGQWVDETAELRPNNDRGVRRVNAEQQILHYAKRHHTDLTILRVAGIYGTERLPREKLVAGMTVVKPEQSSWSNRIHVEDLAYIAFTAMNKSRGINIFNVADSSPSTSADYVLQVAKHFKLPLPELIDCADAQQHLSPMALSFLADDKRVCNKKILTTFNIKLRYPDVDTALANIHAEA